MTTPLVITVMSADKPGLVESLAQAISRHGGNWLESRMARMAGQFAGILRVDIASDQVEALRIDLDGLTHLGINVRSAAWPTHQSNTPCSSTWSATTGRASCMRYRKCWRVME